MVVLPLYAGGTAPRYVLGPAEMDGSVVKTASAALDGATRQWEVDITFTKAGSATFNRYAARHYGCYRKDETNPPFCALQAIDLNGVVESAPAVEARAYDGAATISGSLTQPFSKAEATRVAYMVRTASKAAPL